MSSGPSDNHLNMGNMINKVLFFYGPYAFSLVSLILLWFSIVAPVLEKQAIDYQRNELMLEKVRSLGSDQLESSRAIERSVIVLDSIVKRINEK